MKAANSDCCNKVRITPLQTILIVNSEPSLHRTSIYCYSSSRISVLWAEAIAMFGHILYYYFIIEVHEPTKMVVTYYRFDDNPTYKPYNMFSSHQTLITQILEH